jgi:hypothetical protein
MLFGTRSRELQRFHVHFAVVVGRSFRTSSNTASPVRAAGSLGSAHTAAEPIEYA